MIKNKKLLKVFPVIFGAVLGYAYYYFIGCRSGSCPIQSNPIISTLYGAAVGAIWILPGKKKKAENENSNN